ncbi:DNA repair protein RAD50 [Vespa velutina]|uniref:DNA repair protein RAD50 n=1 Tax=Vespa velutina TaxID=202808 RepID=UPI001FB513A0|nr:DNA repair protein RAD50 [Vespa velutina]
MSRIRQMSICGVRNFDEQDQPRIRFTRPLTLILGPNGTGKTTLIESLKFATTGDFPPGSDRGKAFIHDKHTSGSRVVKGFVKAEFVNANGCSYTICRTIECLYSGTTSRFKTVDSTLSRREKGTTKAVSVTNRCIDVNTEVISAMGVSKSILNYVIFCHQEELSWPLDDGKKLKEKFDEIFESVRFNKALENFLKCIKNMEQGLRVFKVQKDALKNVVNEVEDKEKKRQNTRNRLEDTTNEIMTIDKELEPIIEKIREIGKMDTQYKTLVAERDKKQLEYDINKQQIESLEENIQVFNGSMTELTNRLEQYDNNLLKKASEITEVEKKLQQIALSEAKIVNIITEKRISVGTLKQKMQDQEKKISYRNKTLNDMLSEWNMRILVDKNTSDIEITALVKNLENKVENLKHETEVKRQKRHEEEEELQKEIDVLRSERSKTESEMNIKDNEVTETRDQINKIRTEITQIGVAANKLCSVETKLVDINKKIDDLSQSCDVNNIKEQINDETAIRDTLELEITAIDAEIEVLHKHATLQAEMALHNSTMETKEKEVECFKKKHEDTIKMLLESDTLPHTKLKDILDPVQQKLMDRIETTTHDIQTEQQKLVTITTTLKYNEEELQNKQSELQSNKQKISSVCDYKDFDEVLLLQSKKVKDLQDKRGIYAYQNTAYKEYLKQIKKQDPCCPLCHRNFDESYELDALVKEMEGDIKNQPEILKRCEANLKMEQNKYDTMLQLKPIVEKISLLEDVEIPKLEGNLISTKEELTKHQANIQEKEKLKAIPEDILNKSKSLFENVMLWDRLIDETNNLKEKILNIEELMVKTGTNNTRTVSEAQAQRDSLKASLKKSRDQIQYLQTKLNTFNEKLQHAREERNILFEEQLKIQSDMQRLKELRDKQTELYSRQVMLIESVQKLQDRFSSEDSKLETAVCQLDLLKKENWIKEEDDRKIVTERGRQLFDLNKIQNEVNTFNQCNILDTLTKLEHEIKTYEGKIIENDTEKNKLQTKIKDLKDDISHQETRKRNLNDNLKLRKLQLTAQDLQKQCQNLNEKLENMNYKQMMEKWQKFKNHEESLLRKKNVAKGKQEELERTLLQYTEELQKENYRLARKNYMDKCIELTIQNEAVSDLKKYCKVLDAAMMKYHKERMATVNKIIKKLWKAIYIGNDTSSIEIRTNDTSGTASGRRSYDYKLVQIKNGREMDMRGRCSAGQKVLASIIIRLALAETFCKDCGVLALDEPTTNLDEENMNSLADALNMIVKIRSRYQKNFQLIVISHDEKFLVKLAQLNNSVGYYELYRKENGLSSIRFREMGTDPFHEPLPKQELALSDMEEDERNDSFQQIQSKKRSFDNRKDDDNNRPAKKRFVLKL